MLHGNVAPVEDLEESWMEDVHLGLPYLACPDQPKVTMYGSIDTAAISEKTTEAEDGSSNRKK